MTPVDDPARVAVSYFFAASSNFGVALSVTIPSETSSRCILPPTLAEAGAAVTASATTTVATMVSRRVMVSSLFSPLWVMDDPAPRLGSPRDCGIG